MKKALVLFFLFISSIMNASVWQTDFEVARKEALATNKFILVDFWATWCRPCKKMELDSWSDEEVKLILENFVLVKVDIDKSKELMIKYGIRSIPYVIVMDGNGQILTSFSDYKSANELKKTLPKYALSTDFLAADLLNQYKLKNYSSSMRLALKYFDYSLYVGKDIKNEVINLGTSYIDESKESMSKKDVDFDEKSQRLELIKLYEYAYKFNFQKLDKIMKEKFTENQILGSNKAFYYFLKYISLKGLNSSEAISLQEKLVSSEEFSSIVSKVDLMLSKNS